MRARTHVYGVVDSLDYLKRGGRIGGAAHLVGLAAVDQARDRGARRRGGGRVQATHPVTVAAVPGRQGRRGRGPRAPGRRQRGRARFRRGRSTCCARPTPSTSWWSGDLGPVVGSHTGPGSVGRVLHHQSGRISPAHGQPRTRPATNLRPWKTRPRTKCSRRQRRRRRSDAVAGRLARQGGRHDRGRRRVGPGPCRPAPDPRGPGLVFGIIVAVMAPRPRRRAGHRRWSGCSTSTPSGAGCGRPTPCSAPSSSPAGWLCWYQARAPASAEDR